MACSKGGQPCSRIYIKMLTGKTINLDVTSSSTVEGVKVLIPGPGGHSP